MQWLKTKIKKYWKYITGLIVISSALAVGQVVITSDANELFTIDRGFSKAEAVQFGVPTTGYSVEIKESITKNFPIKYSEGGGYIAFKPTKIELNTKIKVKDVISSDIATTTLAKPITNGYSYSNSFGAGIDVEVVSKKTQFQKIVKINSLPDLGTIPIGVKTIDIWFEIDTNYTLPLGVITNNIELTEYSKLNRSTIWDSVIDKESVVIETEIIEELGKKYLVKRLPVAYLQSATYPVYTDANINFGSRSQFDSASVDSMRVVKLDTSKFVVCWGDRTDATQEGKCRVATVSGTTPTYGTTVQFASDIINVFINMNICSLGTDKFAVVYADDSLADDGYIRVATTTGTVINGFGTALEFETGDTENPSCAEISTDKVIIGYDDVTDTNTGKAIACTVDEDEIITCGTAIEFDSANDFNPTGDMSCIKLNTDKFACTFNAGDLSGDPPISIAGTVSGTTVTMGNYFLLESTLDTVFAGNDRPTHSSVIDTDKFVVAMSETNGGDNGNNGYVVAVSTATSTDMTVGELTKFSINANYISVASIENNYFTVMGQRDASPLDGQINTCRVDWTDNSIKCGGLETFDSSDPEWMSSILIDTSKLVIGYQDEGGSNDGYVIVGDTCSSGSMDWTDFSHHQEITICGDGGTSGCAATTTTNGYVVLATTTQSVLAATSSAGRIEKTSYDSENNLERPADIAFFDSDQSTLLNWEIERYSTTTGELVAWVEVLDISSTTATTFEMAYGNSSASTCDFGNNVWNDTYVGVWHLPEDPSSTAPQILDSTANNNDGTSAGTMTTSDQVATQVDGGLDFDGTDDHIVMPDIFNAQGIFTISFWLYGRDASSSNYILDISGNNPDNFWRWSNSTSFLWRNFSPTNNLTFSGMAQDTWHYLHSVYDGSSKIGYVDGQFNSSASIGGIHLDSSSSFHLGKLSTSEWNGFIDEFRISTIALDPMDILTDYNMMVDNTTFLSFGAEQTTATEVTETADDDFNWFWWW